MKLIPFQQTIDHYLRRWNPTLRPSTIIGKRYVLTGFAAYLRKHDPQLQSFSQIQRSPHIDGWLEHLLYMKPSSRNITIRMVRLFFEDLIHWQWVEAPPAGLLDDQDLSPDEFYLPKPLPPDLDQAMQRALIEANTFPAMGLLLLRYTGMRLGEMMDLPLNAMESSGPDTYTLRVPVGKTRSERLIPLDARTVALIQRIMEQRASRRKTKLPKHLAHYLMLNPFGRHLSQQGYSFNIKRLTAHLNTTEHIHCHRLRHTFATEMARAGMPVPALMKLMGHKTPKMTLYYVEVAQVDVRKAYDEALVQLRLMHTIQPPALPPHAPMPTQPAIQQGANLMATTIARLEHLRRDTHEPAEAKRLLRLVKRLRKTAHDFKDLL